MKYGAFAYRESVNLGDPIQTLAAMQFLPRVDYWIDRDASHKFRNQKSKVIFNGWFTHHPENWPPAESIQPLFISFHLAEETILNSKSSVDYFRRFAPIGCRDLYTVECFKKRGVPAYFSGCLTLTFKNRFPSRMNSICIVDCHLNHPQWDYPPGCPELLEKLVPESIKKQALYFTHEDTVTDPAGNPHAKLERAQKLLDTYAQAKLIITTRLHCALPSVAFDTPVIFLHKNLDDPRFKGLLNLVHAYSPRNERIEFDWENPPPNPGNAADMGNQLRKICEEFVGE